MLTESEVQRSFRRIFRGGDVTPENLERAEELLEHLRSESPLRHRLESELEELRRLCMAKS